VSRLSDHHIKLTQGVGRCSVPMWRGGLDAGFCDEKAYGERPPCKLWRTAYGEVRRTDGKYAGYVPALACPSHGGPDKPAVHAAETQARP